MRGWRAIAVTVTTVSLLACGGGSSGGEGDPEPSDTDAVGDVGGEDATPEVSTDPSTEPEADSDDVSDTDATEDAAPVARLAFAGDLSVDEVDGNGDPDVNPGERWVVTGAVVFEGADSETAVTVRLASVSPRIAIDDGGETTVDVGADPVDFGLSFAVDDEATGGDVRIDIEAFTDGFDLVEDFVTLDVVEPAASELQWLVPETSEEMGDGDTQMQVGEQWAIAVTLRNDGSIAATGVTISASPSSGTLTVVSEPGDVGTIDSGATYAARVVVEAADDPDEIAPTVTLTADADEGEPAVVVADLPFEAPDTLVLDGSAIEEVDGDGNGVVDVGETGAVVFDVSNGGRFALDALEWRVLLADGMGWTFSEPTGPTSLEPSATGEVRAEFTREAETSTMATLQFRGSSAVRSFHGPFSVMVSLD